MFVSLPPAPPGGADLLNVGRGPGGADRLKAGGVDWATVGRGPDAGTDWLKLPPTTTPGGSD